MTAASGTILEGTPFFSADRSARIDSFVERGLPDPSIRWKQKNARTSRKGQAEDSASVLVRSRLTQCSKGERESVIYF